MVVALGTLQVLAQKDPADIPCDNDEVEFSIQVKSRSRPCLGISSAICQDLLGQLTPGAVFPSRLA